MLHQTNKPEPEVRYQGGKLNESFPVESPVFIQDPFEEKFKRNE